MTALSDGTAAAPAPAPSPSFPGGGDLRFVSVRVNLLPDEIVAGRRTEVVRRQVLIGLGALLALVVLVFGFSWWQTHSAHGDLDGANAAQAGLQQQSRRYAPLVAAKAETATIQGELRQLMAGEVGWNAVLRTLRTTAPKGISVTQIDGTVTAGVPGSAGSDPGSASTAVLNPSGLAQIGSITLSGSAPSKGSVADYADALSRVRGLGPAFVSNVAVADRRTTWTIAVPLTTAALGGRYHGGK